MSIWLLYTVGVLALVGLLVGYALRVPNTRRRVLPPPRSKKAALPAHEEHGRTELFLKTLALKEGGAKWPTVLQDLSVESEPHIRTLLLEMRSEVPADPHTALEAIEGACIAAKHDTPGATRAQLLERALSILRRAA